MTFRSNPFMRTLALLTLLAVGLMLGGCNTTAPSEDLLYQPPAGPSVARIMGSTTQDSGLFGSRHVAYVLLVNGKFVRDAEEAWARNLTLAPGPQDLAVEYRSSVFRARTVFILEAKAGATYLLQMKHGVESPDERRYCEFVIVDAANGQPVTPVKHVYATNSASDTKSNFRPLD